MYCQLFTCFEFFSRYDVFIGNKMNFLQYCNVVLVAQNVTELILTKPQEVRIDQLEIVRKKSGIDTDIVRDPFQCHNSFLTPKNSIE